MEFQEFLDSFETSDLLDLKDDELVLYSRQDLQGKSSLVELIAYPDRMIDDWETVCSTVLQVPFCFIVHDHDQCKTHVHFMISWNNNVQLKYFLKFFNQMLARSGIDPVTGKPFVAAVLIQDVKKPADAYQYLTHDTPKARSDGKFQYSKLDLHNCNGFDIHFVSQMDYKKKYLISKDISEYIIKYNVMDITDVLSFCNRKGEDYYLYLESHSGFFDRLCGGVWKKSERKSKKSN